ncbi:MAG: response regulator transcription factor [Acidobacteria bacterium]|nr:response regulator transcription factor [Acidobacteriota bacterium]
MTRRASAQDPGKKKEPATIVLIDDHPIVRQGLAMLITQEQDMIVCGEADDEASGWLQVSTLKPRVVIVDLSLKSGSGIDLIKQVKREFPDTAILVLSMHDESFHVERALRAGAWGYLTKHEASEKVVIAIRKLLEGEVYLSDGLSPPLLKRLLVGGGDGDISPISGLSDRELQVFELIGTGMGVQEISGQLHLSVKTVETYQTHIKEKLALPSTRKLVQFAILWTHRQHGK